MADFAPLENMPLPKEWPKVVRSAILHVVALAHMSLTYSRSWAANSSLTRVRLQAALDVARSEIAMLTEELRIKDCRLVRIDPRERPHYPPEERLAVLALRAARGWSAAETSRKMFVEVKTIASSPERDGRGDRAALALSRGPERILAASSSFTWSSSTRGGSSRSSRSGEWRSVACVFRIATAIRSMVSSVLVIKIYSW